MTKTLLQQKQRIQASVKPIWVYLGDERYVDNLNSGLPQQVAGYANFWDNDTHGNYWSDHNPETLGSSVSNTPYFIDDNNQDKHPLSAPLEFAALELPSIKPPQEADPTAIEPPPTFAALVIACIALAANASIGLLLYIKKRRR